MPLHRPRGALALRPHRRSESRRPAPAAAGETRATRSRPHRAKPSGAFPSAVRRSAASRAGPSGRGLRHIQSRAAPRPQSASPRPPAGACSSSERCRRARRAGLRCRTGLAVRNALTDPAAALASSIHPHPRARGRSARSTGCASHPGRRNEGGWPSRAARRRRSTPRGRRCKGRRSRRRSRGTTCGARTPRHPRALEGVQGTATPPGRRIKAAGARRSAGSRPRGLADIRRDATA